MTDTVVVQANLLNDFMKEILKGNYSSTQIEKSKLDEAHAELYNHILLLIERQKESNFEIQASTSEIRSVSAELSVTLDENLSFTNALYAGAKDLSAVNSLNYETTSQVIDKIRDMVGYLSNIRESSERAEQSSEKTVLAIDEGLTRVSKIIELSRHIEATTKKSVDFVHDFANLTGKISKIVKTVDEIAKQTEILSFNATIESRRAGTAGQGFAIIAGAIRDLADGSKREVSEIENVISDINGGLQKLTDNVNADYTDVSQSVDHTKAVELSLNAIRDTYAQVGEVIEEIITTSQVQNEIAADVTDKITAIENNSKDVNNGVDTIYQALSRQKSSIAGLSRLSDSLLGASGSLSKLAGKTVMDGFDTVTIQNAAKESFVILNKEILSSREIALLEKDAYLRIIDNVMNRYHTFDTVWANDSKGRFIYSNPPEPAGFTNAKDREWFQAAASGKQYVSPVYISVMTKKPCVTVSLPIVSPSHEIVGVLCADLKLDFSK